MDEGRMPASVIKHKQKLAGMSDEEKKAKFAGKSEVELKSMARRHGYGADSDVYSKHATPKKVEEDKDPCWKGYEMVGMKKKGGRQVPNCVPVKEEQIDELSYDTVARYHRKAAAKFHTGEEPEEKRKKGRDLATRKRAGGMMGIPKAKVMAKEETISEKAPPGAKFERMVKHIKAGYAKDGLTKKEKGIAYATAWKAKKRETED
jgi:hypothetical protein